MSGKTIEELQKDSFRLESRAERWRMEDDEQWGEWIDHIPYINFPPEWQVKVIPPFCGAMARFWIKSGDGNISVYLDTYSRLGYWDGGPYWEVYPLRDDVGRCDMDDVPELLRMIQESLDEMNL